MPQSYQNSSFLAFFYRFDETFDMVLPEGTDVSKTYLLFSVKDQSPVLGEGLLLGEALLPLADIIKEDGDVSLKVSGLSKECDWLIVTFQMNFPGCHHFFQFCLERRTGRTFDP